MLGIDITHSSIRVVNLRKRRAGVIIEPPLSVPLDPTHTQDPHLLGQLIAAALDENGWLKYKAVLNMPGQQGFIRKITPDSVREHLGKNNGHLSKADVERIIQTSKESMLVPNEGMILDFWKGNLHYPSPADKDRNGSLFLLGAAQQSVVRFSQELSVAAGIKLHSLELRSLSAINGLLFNWLDARDLTIAVVYLESDQGQIALIDSSGLIALQTHYFLPEQNNNDITSQTWSVPLRRVFNTLALTKPDYSPRKIFIGGDRSMADRLDSISLELQNSLSVETSLCSPLAGLSWAGSRDQQTDVSDFQPAIGAALDGLSVTPTWFNFLHPQSVRARKKKPISWKPLILILFIAMAILLGMWMTLVQQKILERDDLMNQITRMQPDLKQMDLARRNWELFRSYLPAAQGGYRLSYLGILYEINQLMPDTSDCYITSLTIVGHKSSISVTASDINITGRVSQGDVLTEFIERLNASDIFQEAKMAGSQTREVSDVLYPLSFSVTCNLRQMTR
ncbi:MAG: hypothetical protein JW860_07475 [Sedimentisphaerales bacterium]|nr:hypothetical protein [Sedimentisphaerales bacterium]